MVIFASVFFEMEDLLMNINKLVLNNNKFQQIKKSELPNVRSQALFLLVLAIVVLSGWGSILAYRAFTAPRISSEIYGINQPIPTSFGTIIVSAADDLTGLTSEDLAGVTHGIQNLVLADKAQIQLTVALINRTGKLIKYSPDQFRLMNPADPNLIELAGSTIREGELNPRSSIEATLSFVVPRDGAAYTLLFRDPGNTQVVKINLGEVDVVSAETLLQLHGHK